MGSRRYRIETKDEYVEDVLAWLWGVRIIDTSTGQVVEQWAAQWPTEREAVEYASYRIRDMERANSSHWRVREPRY